MSKQEPRRYEFVFDAETEPFETNLLFLVLTREGARCTRRCIDAGLEEGDEAISVTLPGWLKDIGPRRRPR